MPMLSPISRRLRFTARIVVFASVAFALALVLSPSMAEAQSKGKKNKRNQPGMMSGYPLPGSQGPSAEEQKKMREQMQKMMPGMGGMPGMGMPTDKRKGPKKPQPKRDPNAAEGLDTEALPEGYHVPQVPPEALTTTEEWIEDPFPGENEKETAKSKKIMINRYKAILSAGEFANNDEKELVRKVLVWKLSTLTRKDEPAGGKQYRENASATRREIEKDISSSPSTKSGPRAVRKFLEKTVVEQAPKLFEYHFIARLNGAILLAELSGPDFNEEDAQLRSAAKPCVLASEPLQAMVADRKQLTAVRIWGVNGLVRLAMLPELSAAKRNEIVATLVKQMNDSVREHEWYQWRLAEGLGKLNVIQDQDKMPVVPQALAMVLADPERPKLVRAEAAQSLGRLPYDRDIDLGLVAYETGRLVREMTEEFEKEEQKRSSWKICFIKVYGAFKPIDEEDEKKKLGLLKQVEKPMLGAYKRTVQDAFDVVLPLVAKVVNNPSGIDAPLKTLKKWLDDNPPKNTRLTEGMGPIIKQAGGPPAGEPREAGS